MKKFMTSLVLAIMIFNSSSTLPNKNLQSNYNHKSTIKPPSKEYKTRSIEGNLSW